MTKPKNLVLFVGIGLAVIVLISVAVGIPLYSHYSSKKEEIQEKEKIQKRIDFFSSTLSKIESSPQLEMKDLDELATIYKEISASCRKVTNFSACDNFISQNGLVDKLTSLRAKATPLVQDLYAHSCINSKLLPEFNKLLGLGLADAQIISDMNTEARRQEKDRADLLAAEKVEMKGEISSKMEELRLKNQMITDLESDIKKLKKESESTMNTEAQRQEKDRADSLAAEKVEMEGEISSKMEELRLKNQMITDLESDIKKLKKESESTMNTEAQRQEKDRADSLAAEKVKMEGEISSKMEELRLKNQMITDLESDIKKLKKESESTMNTEAQRQEKDRADSLAAEKVEMEGEISSKMEELDLESDLKKLMTTPIESGKDKKEIEKLKDQLGEVNRELVEEKLKYQNLLDENRKASGKSTKESEPLSLLVPLEKFGTDENLVQAISTFQAEKSKKSLLNAYKICMDVHKDQIHVCDGLFELPGDWKAAIADRAKFRILYDKYDSLELTHLRPAFLKMFVNVFKNHFFPSSDKIDGILFDQLHKPLANQLSTYIEKWFKFLHRKPDLKSDLLKEFKPTGSKVIKYWGHFVKKNDNFAITFEHATDFDRYLGILKDLIERDFLLFKEMVYKLISYVSSRGPSKISLAKPSKIMYQSILDDQKQSFTSALLEMKDLIPEPSFAPLKNLATPPDLCKEINESADAGKVFEKLSQVLKKLLLIKLYKAIKRVYSSYLAPIGPLTSGPLLEVSQQIDPSLIYYMSFISEMFKCHSNNEDLKDTFSSIFKSGIYSKLIDQGVAHSRSIKGFIDPGTNKATISKLLEAESRFFHHYNSILKGQILDKMIGDLTKTTDWDENKQQLVNFYEKYRIVAQNFSYLALKFR